MSGENKGTETVKTSNKQGVDLKRLVSCEIPKGSFGFELRFNNLDNCQTLFYGGAEKRQPRGELFSYRDIHYQEIDLPSGMWKIDKILKQSVRLKRLTSHS